MSFINRAGPKFFVGFLITMITLREIRDGFFRGLKTYVQSIPIRKYLIYLFCLTVLAGLATLVDVKLLSRFQTADHSVLSLLTVVGRYLGRKINPWIGLIGLYILASAAKKKSLSDTVFGAMLASSLSGIFGYGLKFILLRARPDEGHGPFSLFNFAGILQDNENFQSLPSGDVAIVAGAAAYFFYKFKGQFWRWILPVLPLLTGFSRMDLNRHWPSDVLFGIGLGFIVARVLWDFKTWQGRNV